MGVAVDLPLQGMGVARNWRSDKVELRDLRGALTRRAGARDDLSRGRGGDPQSHGARDDLSPWGAAGFVVARERDHLSSCRKCANLDHLNGWKVRFLPYVVVLGRFGSRRGFVPSKIVFVGCGGCAVLGMSGECGA